MLATRIFEFDSAHRVLEHKSKCKHLHGHRYKAEITVWAGKLDKMDMVMDFGDIKECVGGWIDETLDHNILLNSEDPLLTEGINSETLKLIFAGKEPVIFEMVNPTAEVIAEYMWIELTKQFFPNSSPIKLMEVKLWETPNCYARFKNPFFEAS